MKVDLFNRNLPKTVAYLLYLVVVWTVFRMNSIFPDVIEELWFKPVLWLVPLFWLNASGVERINFFGEKKRGVIWGIALGLVYSLFLVYFLRIKQVSLNWNGVGIGLVTAVTENMVFAGYVLPRYLEVFSEKRAIVLTGLIYMAVHLPIVILVIKPDPVSVIGLSMLSLSVGIINGYVRVRSKSTLAPIIGSWCWNVVSLM